MNQLRLEPIIDFPAKTPHQNFENVRERIVVFIPHMRGDGRTIDNDVLVRGEKLEQRKFLCSQVDRLSSPTRASRGDVHLEIGTTTFFGNRECGRRLSARTRASSSRNANGFVR